MKKNGEKGEQIGLFSLEDSKEKKIRKRKKKDEVVENIEEPKMTLHEFDLSKGEIVIGVDEAGRGPLAGNVVAAAAILKKYSNDLDEINDSKKFLNCPYFMHFFAILFYNFNFYIKMSYINKMDFISKIF